MKGGKAKAGASKKTDSKLSVKRKATDSGSTRAAKKGKDPSKPKRPPSAFFVFMEEFRKDFKEKNPNNKQVSVVGKAGGEKWKSLTEAEKAPYVAKANKRKVEYNKAMDVYNNKPAEMGSEKSRSEEEEEGSEKSRSEVNDDEEEEGTEEEDDDDE